LQSAEIAPPPPPSHPLLYSSLALGCVSRTGMSDKMNRVSERIMRIEETLERMAEKVWEHDEVLQHEKEWTAHARET
jgi:hypothetical protein